MTHSPRQAVTTEFEWGTWTIEEGPLTFATSQDSKYCGGDIGTYEAQIVDTGDQVLLTLIEDTCDTRTADVPSGLIPGIEIPNRDTVVMAT
jgi:hypothetical protein